MKFKTLLTEVFYEGSYLKRAAIHDLALSLAGVT